MTSVPNSLSSPTLRTRRRRQVAAASTSLMAMSAVGLLVVGAGPAQAATRIGLGTADSYAVLAGSGITNTGPTTINGYVGTDPTGTIDGLGTVTVNGETHQADTAAHKAKDDLLIAYGVAEGQATTLPITDDLGGKTLTAGVYTSADSMGLTGALTLDAEGDPDAVFVLQAGSTLTTGSGSSVLLARGAQACNVYWQVGSSATLGTTTAFRGNLLAHTSITLNTSATVEGRVLAGGGAVTLDTNVITKPSCTTPDAASPTATATPTATPSATPSASPSASPSATPSATSSVPATSAAPTASAATTPGKTTYGQVRRVPVGAVDTGDGSTS